MIIYNITVKVGWSIHLEWLQWMKEIHMPGMLDTGLFNSSRMLRLLAIDDTEGPTYAVQYSAGNIEQYAVYVEEYQDIQNKKEANKWGNHLVSFSTIMEVVQ